jgi:prepilin-type processing-associated H-X9-DG protein
MKRADLFGIVAMLAALAVFATPLSTRARLRPQSCLENLRRVGMASLLYSVDNFGRFPGCQHSLPSWTTGLAEYCDGSAFVCPRERGSGAKFSIALNDFLTPHPHGAPKLNFSSPNTLPSPKATLMFGEARPDYLKLKFDHFHFAEASENGFTPPRFRLQVDVEKHGAHGNYLFADGHAEILVWRATEKRLSTEGSMFVQPAGAPPSLPERSFPFIAFR